MAGRFEVVRSAPAIGALAGLIALAGCGGDETTTTTTTVTSATETCSSKSAPNVTDLTVENMACEEADALVGDVIQSLSREPFTAAGFECEIRGRSGPASGPILGAEGIHCASGERSFTFSFGD
jgi:hypothetical protein